MKCTQCRNGEYNPRTGKCPACGEIYEAIKQPGLHLPDISFKVIPHRKHRYNTAGDYWQDLDNWQFRVSAMENPDYEFLVLLHELVEWHLTQKRGISEPEIMAFDTAHPELDDPGNDKRAPYHHEHVFAEKMEKMLCKEMGIDWDVYSAAFERLEYE